MPERAETLCRACGLTLNQLATAFGVSVTSIKNWQQKYPSFARAIQQGRDDFDSQNVQMSLLKRALGYQFVEETRALRTWIEKDPETGEEVERSGLVVVKTVTKHVVPGTTAQIYWLNNRQKTRWRLKVESEHSQDEDFVTLLREARERAIAAAQ
jgi:hypothetical protein